MLSTLLEKRRPHLPHDKHDDGTDILSDEQLHNVPLASSHYSQNLATWLNAEWNTQPKSMSQLAASCRTSIQHRAGTVQRMQLCRADLDGSCREAEGREEQTTHR